MARPRLLEKLLPDEAGAAVYQTGFD